MFNTTEVKEVKIAIGALIKTIRKQRNLTQIELAARLNLSRNTIQNLEAGKNFTADTVLLILKDFDLLSDFYREIIEQQNEVEGTKSLY